MAEMQATCTITEASMRWSLSSPGSMDSSFGSDAGWCTSTRKPLAPISVGLALLIKHDRVCPRASSITVSRRRLLHRKVCISILYTC